MKLSSHRLTIGFAVACTALLLAAYKGSLDWLLMLVFLVFLIPGGLKAIKQGFSFVTSKFSGKTDA